MITKWPVLHLFSFRLADEHYRERGIAAGFLRSCIALVTIHRSEEL